MQLEEDSENLRKPLQGVVGRFASEGETLRFNQLEHLTALPPPDFDEYFCTLEGFEPEKRFFPTLPVEASRGCWWRGKDSQGVSRGCAFCNLNLQWKGYRQKKIRQVVREIDELTTRHQVLSVAFVDNVLPHTGSEGLFDGLERLGKDLTLFAETRASTSLEQLRKMRDAGLDQVQVGIESLSSNLLKKMNKGVSVVQNLEIMRNCEALGIRSEGNLILGFPGSDTGDVDQTLRALGHAMAFRPLKPVYFWLGLGSGVWRDYTSFGITSVCNHPHYRILFPVEIEKKCRFVVQSYRGERLYQQKIWKPVLKKIRQWEQQYAELHRDPHAGPILGYRDGRSFLMLYHRRYRSETMRHRLSGASREIYLFCRQNRSLKQIVSKFPEIGTEPLKSFLSMMLVKHLMYEDGGRFLSLAVPMGKTH
jgi:hypothetical protein